jgi:hypothetical protein
VGDEGFADEVADLVGPLTTPEDADLVRAASVVIGAPAGG